MSALALEAINLGPHLVNVTKVGHQHVVSDVSTQPAVFCPRLFMIACQHFPQMFNLGVLLAAASVAALGTGWPDIVVGSLIALLFLRSAIRVLREAWPQFRSTPGRAL